MDKDIVPEVKELSRDHGPGFVTFSLPYDEEMAVLQFQERYGLTPEIVEEYKRYLMVGPVPDNRTWDDDPKHWGGMNDD